MAEYFDPAVREETTRYLTSLLRPEKDELLFWQAFAERSIDRSCSQAKWKFFTHLRASDGAVEMSAASAQREGAGNGERGQDMTDRELTGKGTFRRIINRQRWAMSPVDALMEIGVLPKEKYEDRRRGRIDYLERASALSTSGKPFFIMRDTGIRAEKRPQALRDRI